MRFEHSVDIDRPAADVFAFLTDPEKLHEWQTTTVEVRREASGPLSVGERFGEVHAALGRRLESTVEVVEHDAPHAFAIRIVDGAVPVDGRWTLEPANGGTRLHFVGEGELRGPLRLAERLVARSFDRQFRGYHARLKRLVEAA
jgi:carbon monoxide dehydrogenase subunit G